MNLKVLALKLLLVGLPGVALGAQPSANCIKFEKSVQGAGSPSQKLNRFFDVQWTYFMTEFPEWATYVGYPGQNDRVSDQSLAAVSKNKAETRCMLKALLRIPNKGLSPKDLMNYELQKAGFERQIAGEKFPHEFLPISQLNGIQSDFVNLLTAMPTVTKKDFQNILSRLEKFPSVEAQVEERLRGGMKNQVMAVKMFMPKVLYQINGLLTAKPEDSPFYKVFSQMPESLPKEDQAELRARASTVIRDQVFPALTRLRDFLSKEYIPAARETTAWSQMPDGKAWYAYLVREHTTTEKSPDELHELGLSEVKRIAAEMESIKRKVNFKGDLKAFNKFLLKDKQFYYRSTEDLLNGYRIIAKNIDAELPKMFKTLPRLTYGIKPVPDFQAPSAPGAYYEGGSLEAGRAGYFVANTYDLRSRPKWDMETLTFHEAVPGHHFQIALAQELGDMPNFRKYSSYTAFSEGWALYAESLGVEMGFYKDPYSMYGHLAAEMMRAVRLVVDTGLHAKGWSKQTALDFYRANLPATDVESEIEIDRYIVWPGQALAYKVGQLKFKELRALAQLELGQAFDVREFHHEVLRHGAIPLDVLEKLVKQWIKAQKK